MKQKALLKTMLLLCALIVGSSSALATELISWSRSGSTDSYTNGYTFSAAADGKSGYYQDGSGTERSIMLYHKTNKLFSSTPGSVTFTAKLGGGTTKDPLGNSVYVCFVDEKGAVIDGSSVVVTTKITNTTGSDFSVSMSSSLATDAYGVKIYHEKESGYNVRYYSFSLSYEAATAPKTNTTLVLSPNPLNLTYGGGQGTLTATVTPEGGSALSNPTITWESSNESVATVSGGTVTPVGEGTCTITATYAGDNSYNGSSSTATVNVTDNRTAVVSAISEIWFQKTLYIGGAIAFDPKVTLADGLTANDVTYSYVSADPSTIQINEGGTYTVLKTGTNIDITVTVSPVAAKATTHKPVSVTFQHNGAYRYTGLTLTEEETFSGSKEITMTIANNPQGPIYYTTNGNDPLEDEMNRIAYDGPFSITVTTTIKARVIDSDGLYSTLQTATYTKVAANKDAITLAAGQTLSFTSFNNAGAYTDHVTNNVKTVYFLASDGDNYKFTGVDFGSFSNSSYKLQLKNSTGTITTSPITATNGFKMTLSVSGSSAAVEVYVGETEITAVNGVYYFENGSAVTIKRSSGTPQISNITLTALKPSRSVTFPDGDQTITVDGETITKAATISPSPTGTVTYSSSDATVATVNATTGEVTAVKGGTAVITATVAADADYEESKGSYTVTVNKAATTLAFANAEETVELVNGTATFTATATPVDGTRTITYSSETATVNSSTGAVTLAETGDFVIKANATATDKYLAPSEASYTLHVIDSRVPVVDVASLNLVLTDDDENNIALNGVTMNDMGTISATYTKAAGFDGTEVVTFTSSDPEVIEIDDNVFWAHKGGTVTVTVTITSGGNNLFTTVEKEFTVTVTNTSKTPTEIAVMDTETNIYEDGDGLPLTYGTPITLDVSATTGYEGAITSTLDNDQIVSVSVEGTTYTITPLAIGSTTLTLSAAETANFAAASDVALTINVTGATGSTTTPPGEDYYYVYQEEIIGSNSLPTGWTGNGWTAESQYGAVTGTGQTSGTFELVTRDYDLSDYTDIGIDFEHTGKPFSTPSSACRVFVQEGDNTPVELQINTYFTGSSWTYVNSGDIELGNEYDGKTLHFIFRYTPTSGNNGKWEIKNFNIWGIPVPTVDVTLNSSGYATFCCQYPLDFSNADGYTAWYISNVDADDQITFTQITGSIKGGQGILLKGTAGATITLKNTNSETVLSGNKFVGMLAPTYIASDEYFGLSGNTFVPVNSGTVPAGKALLPVSAVPGSGSRMTFVFEDATGIATIEHSPMNNNRYYNLSGQRVDSPKKGMYIVNGKKVVVK